MSEIKTVALAGASGTLGPHVLKALVDAKFHVKVLTRSSKPGKFDASVEVAEVDYASVDSLTAALKGVDAVVSTVSSIAIGSQKPLIDAAVAAGVNRFIPSEYGCVTTNPDLKTLPLYSDFTAIREHLQAKANAGQLTWTVLASGGFLELVFGGGLLKWAERKAELLDEGDNRQSLTSLPNVGKAIVGILKNPEATKNKILKVSEVIVTQNQALAIAKKLRPQDKWEVSKVPTSALLEDGLNKIKAGDFSEGAFLGILLGTGFAGDKYGAAYDETDNDLLGIKALTEADVERLVGEHLARS